MNKFGTTKLTILAMLTILAASGLGTNVVGHDQLISSPQRSTLRLSSYEEIPEATEQCSSEELQWWDSLRKVGNDLQRKMDKKSQTKLAVLFAEGVSKGYRIPLKDRPAQVLVLGRFDLPYSVVTRARALRLSGTIELSSEYRADRSIGDVKIVKGLDKEIDDYAVRATRQNIFLPAVKDGAFVTSWESGSLTFSTRN